KPNRSLIESDFLVAFLNSPQGKRQADVAAVGNAQPTVTLGSLSKFLVPLPSREEQQGIAAALTTIRERISSERRVLAGIVGVKAAIASALLTGEVRVNVDQEVAA